MALIIFGAGIFLHLWFILHNWPTTDSEEGTMGLEALHIAYQGAHPIYLYGQNYMGVAEAYLGAIFFHVFGVSIISLRLGMLCCFALFLLALYLLSDLLYGIRVALTSLVLLMGGTIVVLTPELKAVGGVAETLVFGSLLMLLATWLVLKRTEQTVPTMRQVWQRRGAFCVWGLAAGLGFWSHLLVVPFIVCSALLLCFFCWHEIRSRTVLSLLTGLVVGVLPVIIYNLISPLADNTLTVFINLHHTVYPGAPTGIVLWLKQCVGTLLYTLPQSTDMLQLGDQSMLPFYAPSISTINLPVVLLYALWSLGYLALLSCATLLTLAAMRRARQRMRQVYTWDEKRRFILLTCRLMLLLSAWLTLASYITSATAAERPWSFRYLMGLLISLPAVIAPLVLSEWKIRIGKRKNLPGLQGLLLVLVLAVNVAGTVQDFPLVSQGDVRIQRQEQLVQRLLQLGITRIYSGYWVCDRLIFQSGEKIICAVVDEHLKPGLTRYAPYRAIVDQSKQAAYVFTTNGDFHPAKTIAAFAANKAYVELYINEYIVFVRAYRAP